MMVILWAHSESTSRFLSMSVLPVVIAARSCVHVTNDVKFANSFENFHSDLALEYYLFVSSVHQSLSTSQRKYPLNWGGLEKLKTSLNIATPSLRMVMKKGRLLLIILVMFFMKHLPSCDYI